MQRVAMAVIGGAQAQLTVSMTRFGLQAAALTVGDLLHFVLPKRTEPVVFVEAVGARAGDQRPRAARHEGGSLLPIDIHGLLLLSAGGGLTASGARPRPLKSHAGLPTLDG